MLPWQHFLGWLTQQGRLQEHGADVAWVDIGREPLEGCGRSAGGEELTSSVAGPVPLGSSHTEDLLVRH